MRKVMLCAVLVVGCSALDETAILTTAQPRATTAPIVGAIQPQTLVTPTPRPQPTPSPTPTLAPLGEQPVPAWTPSTEPTTQVGTPSAQV